MASRHKHDPRGFLLLVWLCGFLVNLLMVIGLFLVRWIEKESVWTSLSQLTAFHAPCLVLTLVCSFKGKLPGIAGDSRKWTWLAITVSLVWNVLSVSLLVSVWLERLTIEQAVGVLNAVCVWAGWLPFAVIAMRFGSCGGLAGASVHGAPPST
jgi:hypothetical protein